jgi:transcriptional regulator with XRE-family HTH domain
VDCEFSFPLRYIIMATKIDVLSRFGKQVRELRTAKGLSQEAFADNCRLDRTYIGGIERGTRNVSLRNINILATALGVSLSELMEGL